MFRDFHITSTIDLAPASAAFYCAGGCQNTLFENLYVMPNFAGSTVGTVIYIAGLADTINVENCEFWHVKGSGVRAASPSSAQPSSSIFISCTRITGIDYPGSVGIRLSGNTGGVFIESSDAIGLDAGVHVADEAGVGGNRELFLTHVSLDSCNTGLSIQDGCFVSVVGCWAASCRYQNIHVGFGQPTLQISGGTIFNAGKINPPNPGGGAHGLVVNSGTFSVNGVAIRHNIQDFGSGNIRGIGIFVANCGVSGYVITGCTFIDNAQALFLTGHSFICSNNVFRYNPSIPIQPYPNNRQPNYIWAGSTNYIYNNNVFDDGRTC
jgi:hypothetical protein